MEGKTVRVRTERRPVSSSSRISALCIGLSLQLAERRKMGLNQAAKDARIRIRF